MQIPAILMLSLLLCTQFAHAAPSAQQQIVGNWKTHDQNLQYLGAMQILPDTNGLIVIHFCQEQPLADLKQCWETSSTTYTGGPNSSGVFHMDDGDPAQSFDLWIDSADTDLLIRTWGVEHIWYKRM